MSEHENKNTTATESESEPESREVRVKVYTIDREVREVKLGRASYEEFSTILGTLRATFETVRTNKSYMLIDENGLVHIFNADNVTFIQVERRD